MSTHQGEYIAALPASETMSVDTLMVMLEQERTTYSCRDYLNAANFDERDFCLGDTRPDDCGEDTDSCITVHPEGLGHGDNRRAISPEDRTKMVDWCYDIVDKCKFSRETVAVAMDIVDRFASLTSSPGSGHGNPQDCQGGRMAGDVLYSRCEYQLLTLTALYISIKTRERVLISSRVISDMSQGMYTTEEIEEMERTILRRLQWRLCSPTALQVGYQVLELMEEWAALRPRGRKSQKRPMASREALHFIRGELAFQTEIAVRDYCFVVRRPSTVAVASLLNAIEQVDDDECCELLGQALLCVLRRFDFEEPKILLQVMGCLEALLEENE